MVPLDTALVNNHPWTWEYVLTRAEEKTKHVSQVSCSHVRTRPWDFWNVDQATSPLCQLSWLGCFINTNSMVINNTGSTLIISHPPPPHLDMILRQFHVLGVVQNTFLHPQQIKDYEFRLFCICITQYIYLIQFSNFCTKQFIIYEHLIRII
jgi:hypothetical protein